MPNYLQTQREAICRFLQITDEQYSQAVFETGCQLALRQGCGVEAWANLKTATSEYWDWYTNQFAILDESFLRCYRISGSGTIDMLRLMWHDHHAPENNRTFPPTLVYKQAEKIRKEAKV